jgi:hypothetical protein
MTAPQEPLQIGRLLSETLRFIFTRPHLWLMAWAPGFVLSVGAGTWAWFGLAMGLSWRNQQTTLGIPIAVFVMMVVITIFSALTSPLLYRVYFVWRTSTPTAMTRSLTSSMLRAILPAIFLVSPFIFLLIAIVFVETFFKGRFIDYSIALLAFFLCQMFHYLVAHATTLAGDGDTTRSWRANLRTMRGQLPTLFFTGIPVSLVSISFLFAASLVSKVIFIALVEIFGVNWQSDLPRVWSYFVGSFLFTSAYFTAALPIQVFHAAVHIRLLEISKGTALGAKIGNVFK